MSIGKQEELQGTLWLSYDQLPKSMGHAFYDRLQRLLLKGQFDSLAENLCEPYYAKGKGRPSVPPGRYFRMLFVGYFEGIDSERGICWRCADSLSLREFLRLDIKQAVPDHSSLSRIRSRLPIEIHHEIYLFVLKLLAEAKLVHGKRLGIDASTMEANAALKTIVRRDSGEDYDAMLTRMAEESGIVAVKIHQADKGDTEIMHDTLATAKRNLKVVQGKTAPKYDNPADLAADKGYHSRNALVKLDSVFRSRVSEPERRGVSHWHGDTDARRAVYNNRARLQSATGKELQKHRSERVERSFAHCLDNGGMRRTHLRGTENIEKRYLIHVSGFNLGLLMRSLFKIGTPKGWADLPATLILAVFEARIVVIIQNETENQILLAVCINW